MAAKAIGMGRDGELSMDSVLIVALNQIYVVNMNLMFYFLDLLWCVLRREKKKININK